MNKEKVIDISPMDLEKAELLLDAGVKYDRIEKTLGIKADLLKEHLKRKKQQKQLEEQQKLRKQHQLDDNSEEGYDSNEVVYKKSKFSTSIEKSKPSSQVETDNPQNDIERMRLLRYMGHSIYTIATTFGVSVNSINKFVRDIKPKNPIRAARYELTPDDITQIKFMKDKGFTSDQISRFIGVTEICIIQAIRNHKL